MLQLSLIYVLHDAVMGVEQVLTSPVIEQVAQLVVEVTELVELVAIVVAKVIVRPV